MRLDALLVEDDAEQLRPLAEIVEGLGFSVRTASSLAEARASVEHRRPDVVITDLMLPDGEGLELRSDALAMAEAEFILVTGHATIESAVAALRTGVLDYLTKPVDVDHLERVLGNVARTAALRKDIGSLRDELRKFGRFGAMVGASTAMQRVYDLVTRVAPTDVTVLVTGESGTGKELVAATIHELSRRRTGPFVAINCGAVSPTLVESELFGHERGSFTDALQRHRGHFERASGGTLFLDEVTEMPLELQTKLLRVLETRQVLRIGGTQGIPIDLRIVAATNRVPLQAVKEGKLREDLFYRLSVFPIALPPLRDRPGDVALLSRYVVEQQAQANERLYRLTDEVMMRFERYNWPGNVRELKNVIERACILAANDEIDAACIPDEIGLPAAEPAAPSAAPLTVGTSLAEAERHLILATLGHFGGDKKRAAEMLGISLKTLYNRLNLYTRAA